MSEFFHNACGQDPLPVGKSVNIRTLLKYSNVGQHFIMQNIKYNGVVLFLVQMY